MSKVSAKHSLQSINQLPNLHKMKVSSHELSSDYWTPEKKGDYRVGLIHKIKNELCLSQDGSSEIDLLCVIMLAQDTDGNFSCIRNGSKRLVAMIQKCLESGEIVLDETPVRITYIGKRKNKTNIYEGDGWSVKPIILS